MTKLALAALLVWPALAVAAPDPSFEIVDRGDAIEVIAHNIKAARTAISPTRSRLEVELVGSPFAKPFSSNDKGVKVIELEGQNPRRLSVKLPLERPDVKTLARYAQVIQVGDDLHLLFPRAVPAEGARITLPEPTLPPELAAKLDATKPALAIGPEKPVARPVVEPKPELKPEVAAPAAPAKPEQPFLREEPSSNMSMYVMLGLAAIGVGIWLVRRRRAAPKTPASSIEVIAQRSLGAKSKVVWLAAGGREMIIAVTPQQVRMLGQWRKQEPAAALPEAHMLESRRAEPEKPANPSVAGILRLRNQRASAIHNVPIEAFNEDVATGDIDADALWAKEMLAATGARR
jgi:flagellar biogenesis protein FliO